MALDLAFALDVALPPGTKGLPAVPPGFTLADIAGAGWNVLAGDLPMPVAILKRSALDANIAAMQAYAARHGASLAPHGKTSMSPQLFARQLDAGAWGITVATAAHAALCDRAGAQRILIANQLAGEAEVALVATLAARSPDRAFHVLVDSAEGAALLQQGFERAGGGARIRVLIELGHAGGRTGVRSVEQGVALARTVVGLDRLTLVGIEGYEGLMVGDDPAADAQRVDAYLEQLVALLAAVRGEGLFAGDRILLTAGGSAYYDLVARRFGALDDGAVDLLLRSGCYVTHDTGFYARHRANAQSRAALGPPPRLVNALEVWTRVQSMPEPGLAILTAGKRDLSYDIELPRPIAFLAAGAVHAPQPIEGWQISALSDQHAFLVRDSGGEATPLQIGDLIGLGISHPCTTFDKWQVLFEVSDDYAVIGGLKTFF
ncbi:hypothetical protein DAH66_17550 [Sphingomonas koreensis]|uniref:D-serine dehydratase-like domain-containing protein n=1 Tax=Sphingomonas koreensis TaxID=93064 RepID=A0A430FZV9_9SPHN|nr:hypothetical protein [Sphingomonas koreensis]RSY79369.1 hypothetical protein DAH66_17550 [Sphingomonas koreensis]